ncbi:hypothetical protein cyc_08004 [Cyclospora cayetanensis]|uniref:Transmembrane protein n=1 Tax=Cyclospora cayetanensis TaxID=88456 RepID=A0A1D3CXF8_9EIME|nr:hypothetical protein cyc_08004 [Cyclospora cayetanensis]
MLIIYAVYFVFCALVVCGGKPSSGALENAYESHFSVAQEQRDSRSLVSGQQKMFAEIPAAAPAQMSAELPEEMPAEISAEPPDPAQVQADSHVFIYERLGTRSLTDWILRNKALVLAEVIRTSQPAAAQNLILTSPWVSRDPAPGTQQETASHTQSSSVISTSASGSQMASSREDSGPTSDSKDSVGRPVGKNEGPDGGTFDSDGGAVLDSVSSPGAPVGSKRFSAVLGIACVSLQRVRHYPLFTVDAPANGIGLLGSPFTPFSEDSLQLLFRCL